MKLSYAALHCLSNFSFLRAASHPEELIARAAELGYSALALTDECSVAGVVRAHVAAKEHSISLIVGSEFVLTDAPEIERIVLYATDRESYGDLCELITLARSRSEKGSYRLYLRDLQEKMPRVLCVAIAARYAHRHDLSVSIERLQTLYRENFWLGVSLRYDEDDLATLQAAMSIATFRNVNLVAMESVVMHCRERKPLLDVLYATHEHERVDSLGNRALCNSEGFLKHIEQIEKRYPLEILFETVNLASRCTFSLDELQYEYPREVVPAEETPTSYLRKLTYRGIDDRYPLGAPSQILGLVEHELRIIEELRYEAYFLTIYDVVVFARSRGILCQGRGSAANSVVCFCLGITEVDPAQLQTLFERFISRERKEPPDIDVDFEHERREEVIQYLYRKYGRDRTALTATVATYRSKGAIRDVAKALGFSLDQVDALAKAIVWWDGRTIENQRLIEAGFDPENPTVQRLMELTHQLMGFPRHLSQHTGGFVIARDLLVRLVPVENAAMPERTVIQWDKDDLDELKLIKVDVLALGMLTAIRKTIDELNRFYGSSMTVRDIPNDSDRPTYEMIQRADTIGVFQIESRAQMSMLPRLKPKRFYDLVIEVAIVRPGPIQGGMVHPYLRRRNGLEPITYPSKEVEKVLERTLGVSIFQEQVMQLAMVAAGFTAGRADQLRRAMAAWKRKGGIMPFREELIAGMLARGYTLEYAEQIFKQMNGFGEYGFPESHAASFALLVFKSCWLKCHHAAAFTCGLLNSQPLGFYTPSQLVQDVKRHGIDVRPVDITVSDYDCVLEAKEDGVLYRLDERWLSCPSPAIRLGLCMVRNLGKDAAERIVSARRQRSFDDVADLKRRALLSREELTSLAAADALQTLSGHRREAYWEAIGAEDDTPAFRAPNDGKQANLLVSSEGQEIVEDYASLGLTLRRHPIALLRPKLRVKKVISAGDIQTTPSGRLVRAAGIVTCRQHPSTAKGTTFVTLEDETGYVNVIVWAGVAERYRKTLVLSRFMMVAGKIERQGSVVHLIAEQLIDETEMLGALATASRDFR
jgi:error-prone DNA polymerase